VHIEKLCNGKASPYHLPSEYRSLTYIIPCFTLLGTAPVQPFMPVFAKQLGFSGVVIGVIYGILPVVGMLSKLFIGYLADRLRLRKVMLLSFLLLGSIAFFGVQFVPDVKTITQKNVRQFSNLGGIASKLNTIDGGRMVQYFLARV